MVVKELDEVDESMFVVGANILIMVALDHVPAYQYCSAQSDRSQERRPSR